MIQVCRAAGKGESTSRVNPPGLRRKESSRRAKAMKRAASQASSRPIGLRRRKAINPRAKTSAPGRRTTQLFARLVQSRVGGFLQPFADQIVREDGQKDGEAWKDDQPPELQVRPRRVQQRAPAWIWRRGAEAEEAQRAFNQDRRRAAKCDWHQDGRQRVGQDIAKHDTELAHADRLRGDDEVALAQLDEFRPPESGDAGP